MTHSTETASLTSPRKPVGTPMGTATVDFFLPGGPRSPIEVERELAALDGVFYAEVEANLWHVRISYDREAISPGRLLAVSKGARAAASRPSEPERERWIRRARLAARRGSR